MLPPVMHLLLFDELQNEDFLSGHTLFTMLNGASKAPIAEPQANQKLGPATGEAKYKPPRRDPLQYPVINVTDEDVMKRLRSRDKVSDVQPLCGLRF